MPRRIRRPADKEKVFMAMTMGDNAVFKTYKALMVCAACIGFAHKQREPFDKPIGPIAWSTFSGPTDAAVINAIALSETGDLRILLEDEDAYNQRFTIFEEYANGGLAIIQQRILSAPGCVLDNMVDLIFDYSSDRREEPDMGILQRLAKEIREK